MRSYSISLNDNFKPDNDENNEKIIRILQSVAGMSADIASEFVSQLGTSSKNLILYSGGHQAEQDLRKLGLVLKLKTGLTFRQLRDKLNLIQEEFLDEKVVIFTHEQKCETGEIEITPEGCVFDTAYDLGADPFHAKKDFMVEGVPYLEVFNYTY
jgi:hypothetical protein